ncbi:UNVERIFIED_CONTAM: hypothetical protein FKN15_039988 [Acipenser sinensis]
MLAFHARYLRFGARAPALLVSALLRLVQRFGALCSASALGAWCSVLGIRCSTHLDARCSVHAPRRSTLRRSTLGASTLGARTLTLDAQYTHLNARRFGASTLGARTSTLDARCTQLDARRFGASTLGARTSTLGARRTFDVVLDGNVGLPSLHVLPGEAACQ